MLRLDTATVITITMINVFTMLLTLLHTRLTRKTYPGFAAMTGGTACWLFGAILVYNLRGVAPLFLSLVVGQTLMVLQHAMLLEGFYRFHGIPGHWWRTPLNLAIVATVTLLLYTYGIARDDLPVRGMVLGATMAFFYARCAFEPLFYARARRYSMQVVVSVTMMPLVLINLMRIPFHLAHPEIREFAQVIALGQGTQLPLIYGNFIIFVLTYGYISLTSDRVELELRESRERERQSMQARRRFFDMVTHEFKTPLAAMDRAAQMIAVKLPQAEESITSRVRTIRDNAARLYALTEAALHDDRLAREELHPVREPLDLVPLLRELCERHADQSARRQFLFEHHPAQCPIKADGRMLSYLFNNLLDNAGKFSPEGAPVVVGLDLSAAGCRVTVADQGIGIPPEELPVVGSRLFRASNSTGIPGSGIGLQSAVFITKLHNGSLTLENRENGGILATVQLPLSA